MPKNICRNVYRNFPGRLSVKSVAIDSKWWKASGNRGHNHGFLCIMGSPWSQMCQHRWSADNGVLQRGIICSYRPTASCHPCWTIRKLLWRFITARRSYASAVLGVVILSVHHTRALWLIQRTYRRYFYTIWKGNPSSFLPPNSGWWATTLSTQNGRSKWPTPSKIAHVVRFPPVTSQQ